MKTEMIESLLIRVRFIKKKKEKKLACTKADKVILQQLKGSLPCRAHSMSDAAPLLWQQTPLLSLQKEMEHTRTQMARRFYKHNTVSTTATCKFVETCESKRAKTLHLTVSNYCANLEAAGRLYMEVHFLWRPRFHPNFKTCKNTGVTESAFSSSYSNILVSIDLWFNKHIHT